MSTIEPAWRPRIDGHGREKRLFVLDETSTARTACGGTVS
jgi:hypothetical protein